MTSASLGSGLFSKPFKQNFPLKDHLDGKIYHAWFCIIDITDLSVEPKIRC